MDTNKTFPAASACVSGFGKVCTSPCLCLFLILYLLLFLFNIFWVSDIGKVCQCFFFLGIWHWQGVPVLVHLRVSRPVRCLRHTHTHTLSLSLSLSLSLTHSLTDPHTQGLIPSSPVQETGLEKFTFPAGVAEPAISSWASTMPGRAKGRTKTNQVASSSSKVASSSSKVVSKSHCTLPRQKTSTRRW